MDEVTNLKLYKNTLKISVIVFCACVLLSIVFQFTFSSQLKIVPFLSDYAVGIACSIIVVIVTTLLQFKYEQKKLLNSILSDIHFFLLDYLLIVMSLDPSEETPNKLWEYYYDRVCEEMKSVSPKLSDIEWLRRNKTKIVENLQKSILCVRVEFAKSLDNTKKDNLLYVLDTTLLKEIKDNALLLAEFNEYYAKEITKNYEKIQEELNKLKYQNNRKNQEGNCND